MDEKEVEKYLKEVYQFAENAYKLNKGAYVHAINGCCNLIRTNIWFFEKKKEKIEYNSKVFKLIMRQEMKLKELLKKLN